MSFIKKINIDRILTFIFISIFVLSWLYLIFFENLNFAVFFSDKNIEYGSKFLSKLIGIGENPPSYLLPENWTSLMKPLFDTVIMSIIAIGISSIGMITTLFLAARNISSGRLTLRTSSFRKALGVITRASYMFSRAVPELIWAMILILIFKPGILPGALALAFHNFGILSKLCAETIEDMETRPSISLALAGATTVQILFYSVLPSIFPRILTYIIYRWEVILRSTVIVGFIGAGGLGMNFKLAMSYFNYSLVTLIMLAYFALVIGSDILSGLARKAAE